MAWNVALLCFCFSLVASLRVKDVTVPGYSRTGETVTLVCNFDLEGDQLYNLKWYKGTKEFFRYVPADNPPIQIFTASGVNVDPSRSSINKVVLYGLSRTSSGTYKCEVSAEAPGFNTDSGSGKLLVVDLPQVPPRLSGVQMFYHLGDVVEVNCSSRSKPAPSLSWYIADKKVQADKGHLQEYAPTRGLHGLETSTLGLRFQLRRRHLRHGLLSLKCGATIASVFYNETRVDIRSKMGPNPNNKEKLTGSGASPQSLSIQISIFILFVAALRELVR